PAPRNEVTRQRLRHSASAPGSEPVHHVVEQRPGGVLAHQPDEGTQVGQQLPFSTAWGRRLPAVAAVRGRSGGPPRVWAGRGLGQLIPGLEVYQASRPGLCYRPLGAILHNRQWHSLKHDTVRRADTESPYNGLAATGRLPTCRWESPQGSLPGSERGRLRLVS